MSKTQNALFELIRSSLWDINANKSVVGNLSTTEWTEITQMASKNAVVLLVLDAISKLMENSDNAGEAKTNDVDSVESSFAKPSKMILLPLIALGQQKEEHNRLCAEVLAEVSNLYKNNDVEFLLLKGLGIASIYPKPQLRDGGDIDLLILDDSNDVANDLFVSLNARKLENNIKHTSFQYKGVCVENHHQLSVISPVNRRLKQIQGDNYDNFMLEQEKIATLEPTVGALYLIEHIAMHYVASGIGLRHLCDLAMFFYVKREDIDVETFRNELRSLKIESLTARLAWIVCDKLGLDPMFMPVVPINDTLTQKILQDIVTGGNFGTSNESQKIIKSNSKYMHKFNTLLVMIRRWYELRKLGSGIFFAQIKETLYFNCKNIIGR